VGLFESLRKALLRQVEPHLVVISRRRPRRGNRNGDVFLLGFGVYG